MADEALREALAEYRDTEASIAAALTGEIQPRSRRSLERDLKALKRYADALESALSELARLRALRDHGKYLADAAEIYLNVMSDDDPEPDLSADSYGALRSCVYEFRKRFAQTSSFQLKSAPADAARDHPTDE